MQCSPHGEPVSESPEHAEIPDSQGVSDPLDEVAKKVADEVPQAEIAALVRSIRQTNLRPRDKDAKLLAISRRILGEDLDSSQKSNVRAAFLSALEARLN